jgi:DNA-damage-inducible protein D
MTIFNTMEEGINSSQDVSQPTPTFEDFSHENGITYWWASEFMAMLGYSTMTSFTKPLNRAMQACLSINIDCHDNFKKTERVIDGNTVTDYKITRFGCYMIAMNGDVKKQEVASAQVYFANQAEQINLLLAGSNDVDRLILRDEIKGGNKSLMSTAKHSGVVNYGLFMDAGYRGMYNSSIKAVAKKKGLEVSKNLFDYMGKTELSANWFRITLTEEKLKQQAVSHETHANQIHKQVGSDIRKMVKENTGLNPEQLPVERRLGDVSKELKKANKQLNKKKNT